MAAPMLAFADGLIGGGSGSGAGNTNALTSGQNTLLTNAVQRGESDVVLNRGISDTNNVKRIGYDPTTTSLFDENGIARFLTASGATSILDNSGQARVLVGNFSSGTVGTVIYSADGSVGMRVTNGSAAVFPGTAYGSFAGDGSQLGNINLANVTGALASWITSQNFASSIISRDSFEVVTSITVTFPDGGNGRFITTSNNPAYRTVDAYTCTYTNGAITHLFTQPTILRDAAGAATNVPALIQNN